MIQANYMVGAGVLCLPTLGYGELILCATLGGAGVSTLGGAELPELSNGDVCSNLGGALGLSMWH